MMQNTVIVICLIFAACFVTIVQAATVIAAPACMAFCLSTAVVIVCPGCVIGGAATGGLACVPCGQMIASCSAGCACFHSNTTVETQSGIKHISNINNTDLVKTAHSESTPISPSPSGTYFTRVLGNEWVPSYSEFLVFGFDSGPKHALKVTTKHPIVLFNDNNKTIIQPTAAENAVVGDKMLVYDETTAMMRPAKLSSIDKIEEHGKWALETETCSMLADGVLTKTYCAREYV